MTDKEIVGVILAAGKATRMEPFSNKYPKAILPVCNKSIMIHQIDYMKKIGIKEVIVVIGHLGYEIVKSLASDSLSGINIRYVEQEETLGIAHALGKLEPYISSPLMVFLGDIYFGAIDLSVMVDTFQADGAGAVLAVKKEMDPMAIQKNFSIIMDDNGLVKRVIEKPRYIYNDMKGCGIYLFDLSIFDAIRRTPRTAMRDEYEITESIQILIDDGIPVKVEPVIKWDVNLTFPYDLLKCNINQLKLSGKNRMVSSKSHIHPQARIVNSIIGDRVTINNPIEIKNTLIFSDSIVDSKKKLDGVIITPEQIIDCKPWL